MASPTAAPTGALPAFAVCLDAAAACGRRPGKEAALPPPGPRRTPDHPPYAEMIQVALRELAEEGGSTAVAISRRIAAVYLDLPSAHDRLFPHYLRRLVAAGDVAVIGPGRYALLYPSTFPSVGANPTNPSPILNPNPNPSPFWPSTSFAAHLDAPAAAAAVTPRSSSSSATAAVVEEGAGKGLGSQALAIAVADGEGQCDRPLIPTAASSNGGDDGRPSVPHPASATAFATRQDGQPLGAIACYHVPFVESKGSVKRGRGRPPLTKRGRGRPPFNAKHRWEPPMGTRVSDPIICGASIAKCEKGREPNSFIFSRDGQEGLPASDPPVLPRRGRGRPRKYKPAVVAPDVIAAEGDVHSLDVTSSQDPKNMMLDGVVCSSLSPGDATSSAGGEVLSNCGATPSLQVILQLPSKPECSLANDCSTADLSLLAQQLAVHVPKGPGTSMDHKPSKNSTAQFEESVSNGPLIQSSEEMVCATVSNGPFIESSEPFVCALLASVQDSLPNNITSSRPQIDGWVQVLLAVQPTTANVRQARERKKKKSKSHCKEGKLVQPTAQFSPDNFLPTSMVENVEQMGVWLQTSMTELSDTDDLLLGKVDENRKHIEKCMQLLSAISAHTNGSFRPTEEESLPDVDRGGESICNAPFLATAEENWMHDVAHGQMLPIGHSMLDGSLWAGNEECSTQAGGFIQSFPSEQFTPADSLQITTENVANVEKSMQLPVAGLSMTEDGLQREETIRLHAEASVSGPLVKQLANKELEDKTQDERSMQEFPVQQSRPEDDLPAGEVTEPDSRRSLQMLPQFGGDLQTVDISKPPSVEFLLACTAEQYALGDTLQSQEVDNSPEDEEFIQELHVRHFKHSDELQSEEKNESDSGNCVKALPHEQAKLPVEFLLACTAEQYALGDTLQSQEVDDSPEDEESVQELHVQHFNPSDELQSEEKNESDSGNCVKALPHEQAKLPVEFLLACTAEQYALGDTLQSQGVDDSPEDEESVQELHVQHFKPSDELQSEEKNESDSGNYVKALPHEQAKLPVEFLLACTAEQYALGDTLQSQEVDDSPEDEESVQELHVQHFKPSDELQSEEKNESDSGNCVKALTHEQAKLQDDLLFEKDKNGTHAIGCMIEFLAKEPSNVNSSWMHQLHEGSQEEVFDQRLSAEQKSPGDELQTDLPVDKDKNGTHPLECMIESSEKEPLNVDSSQMHLLQEGSHDELFNQKLTAERKSPEDELEAESINQLHAEKYAHVLHEEQPKLGVDLLSEADENGRDAEGDVLAPPEKGPNHGSSLQAQELENWLLDGEFTQEIPMDQHPIEDDLQRKVHVESHADECLQVFSQEQHKPGDDLQMEDRSRAQSEGLILQLLPEKSTVNDFSQISEPENNIETGESIQDSPTKLSEPEDPLQMMDSNELHSDGFLQGPGAEWLKTSYPLLSEGEKNVSLKRNRKRQRRLWFEC